MSSLNIRTSILEDASMLANMAKTTFYDTFAHSTSEKNMREYMDSTYTVDNLKSELSDPDITYYVLEQDSQPIGFLKLNRSRSHAPECVTGKNPMELGRIYLIKEKMGKGLGSTLMEKCISDAKKWGHDSIWLGVWEFNFVAQKFYAKYGFNKVGSWIFSVGDDDQTDWILQKFL
eukprot:TRINITY_DN7960_c0_g1_i1.p1 TRINITY_DN7960_c0_g1~~TRINITY_DN7960_c0_g1_i1.p1  ORF type:complete len:175 (+),score=15.68 TRINITY_DN7960_c0_g1_i1:34-558(+)